MSAKEKICPYCGKPAGELALCTNCGAELYKRTTFRLSLLAVGVILVIGVAATYQAALGGVLLMRIGDLTDIHNYTYWWFEGTVSGGPRYRRFPSVRLDFSITDDWGDSIAVRAYSEDAEVLVRENRIPRVGDRVRFLGMAQVELGRRWIVVDNAQTKFELHRGQVIVTAYLYKPVSVRGAVVGEPSELTTAYTLADENYQASTLSVYIHKGLWELANYHSSLMTGSKLKIVGGITSGAQLVPSSLEDIEVVG